MNRLIQRLFQRRALEERRASNASQELWDRELDVLNQAGIYIVGESILDVRRKTLTRKQKPQDKRTAFVSIIDKNGFNTKVFLVAASGFFTDSYNLFASNVILPALAFAYWDLDNGQTNETAINTLTLAGSCVGQVLFGFLADICGRQRLYGVELVIVIFATLGFAASGPGLRVLDQTSMSINSWLKFWRFVIGIGIGAEYPLSAAISIEWSAKQSRARMMSAVFLMQPLGQLCAYGVGLAVLHGLSTPFGPYDFRNNGDGRNAKIGIDILWRIVTGVGCVPALIALIFRWTIPESGRYTSDIQRDVDRAYTDTKDGVRTLGSSVFDIFSDFFARRGKDEPQAEAGVSNSSDVEDVLTNESMRSPVQERDFAAQSGPRRSVARTATIDRTKDGSVEAAVAVNGGTTREESAHSITESRQPNITVTQETAEQDTESEHSLDLKEDQPWTQFSGAELHSYFIKGGNWRYLLGACLAWFFLDLPFYGLGFNSSATLAKLWTAHRNDTTIKKPFWLLISGAINMEDASIFSALNRNGIESIATVAVWSLLGCAYMTWRIKYIDRRYTLIWTSIVLATLLLVLAIAFPHLFHKPGHSWLIVLYAVIQVFFSYGPNTLIFVLVAEIFPTRYRCTAYGIAAASGKLGAVVVQVVYKHFALIKDPNSDEFGRIMYLFAACMLMVALSAWWFIPNVQVQKLGAPTDTVFGRSYIVENKTLEDLAEGREKEPPGERTGIRNRTKALKDRIKGNSRNHEGD